MSTVGIVTLPGDTNFGNRLQNFALQEAISSLGVTTVDTIQGLPRRESKELKARRLAATVVGRREELLVRIQARGGSARPPKDTYTSPEERRAAIRSFTDGNIHLVRNGFMGGRPTRAATPRYDRVVVGSDQVWNPAFTHGNPEWFLSFVPESRRGAYAASFGVSSVPSYLRGRYRRGLKAIPAISVREHQAAQVVHELTGRHVPVVLDPTMLIGSWESLAKRPSSLRDGGYVAQFMLAAGDSQGGDSNLTAVGTHARELGLPVVDLHDPTTPELRAMGPLEFIGAIAGAELVVTDSFHAAVFSTLFHRPFLLVKRGVMNSRFDTLLHHIGLSNRILSGAGGVSEVLGINWEHVDARLEKLRSASYAFLAEMLDK